MMSAKKIIKELEALQVLAKAMSQKAYDAQVLLERFSAPAPSGAKKKAPVISESDKAEFISKFRKRIHKKIA